jgi:hypothetical protein
MKSQPGVNIQFPISRMLLDGSKTVETRTYPLPKKYLGKDLILIETPGHSGEFKARAIAIIRFSESFAYPNKKKFYEDVDRHRVSPDSIWAWSSSKPKYGWVVAIIERFSNPIEIKSRRGIKFTRHVELAP